MIYIEGKLQTRTHEKDGVTRYYTEVVAREMKFLSKAESPGTFPSAADAPPEKPKTTRIPIGAAAVAQEQQMEVIGKENEPADMPF